MADNNRHNGEGLLDLEEVIKNELLMKVLMGQYHGESFKVGRIDTEDSNEEDKGPSTETYHVYTFSSGLWHEQRGIEIIRHLVPVGSEKKTVSYSLKSEQGLYFDSKFKNNEM